MQNIYILTLFHHICQYEGFVLNCWGHCIYCRYKLRVRWRLLNHPTHHIWYSKERNGRGYTIHSKNDQKYQKIMTRGSPYQHCWWIGSLPCPWLLCVRPTWTPSKRPCCPTTRPPSWGIGCQVLGVAWLAMQVECIRGQVLAIRYQVLQGRPCCPTTPPPSWGNSC